MLKWENHALIYINDGNKLYGEKLLFCSDCYVTAVISRSLPDEVHSAVLKSVQPTAAFLFSA